MITKTQNKERFLSHVYVACDTLRLRIKLSLHLKATHRQTMKFTYAQDAVGSYTTPVCLFV